jgi:hypothetical protein
MAGRVTQLPVEVVVKPSTQKARITQLPVEVVVKPTTQKARLTQYAVEVVVREITNQTFTETELKQTILITQNKTEEFISGSQTYDERYLTQTLIIAQSKQDTQSMSESSKTTLINLTTTQTDTQTYLENQTQQTILSLQEYTESLILGEAGKTQTTLIMQARSDTVINSELTSTQQIILANTYISDILTHNELNKIQVLSIIQSETDQRFAGIVLETGLNQNVLVNQSATDIHTLKEISKQTIVLNQTQNNNQINVETTNQIIIVTQTVTDAIAIRFKPLNISLQTIERKLDLVNINVRNKNLIIKERACNLEATVMGVETEVF